MAQSGERAQHRRMVEAFRLGEARPARDDPRGNRDDRDADPHVAPRGPEPDADTGHGRARDAPRVEQPVKADEAAGLVRERVGRDDVHDHVDESAGRHRQHERGHEQEQMRCRRFHDEERTPQDEPAGQRAARTPAVGDRAAERGERGRGDDPRREQCAEPRVGEPEGVLDVDGRDRPAASEEAEDEERDGHGSHGGGHAAVSHAALFGAPARRRRPGRSTMVGCRSQSVSGSRVNRSAR